MIELFDQQLKQPDRHSSKGNQLKWKSNDIWYKADYTGYEGLSEYMVSKLLAFSNLEKNEFVAYELEQIKYRNQILTGSKSKDMLQTGWQIITLERLFKNQFDQSLHKAIWSIRGVKERVQFLCEQTERITGIENFGQYLTKLLTIDAFFLNEDRHTHNIAILMSSTGEFKLCPIFDNGAGLLADTKMDYPLSDDVFQLMSTVHAKTISRDFDEQLEAAEELYGQQIRFTFSKKDVDHLLNGVSIYSREEIERVRIILYQQIRKYSYLFSK